MVEDSRFDGSVLPVVASQCQASPVQGTTKGEGGRGGAFLARRVDDKEGRVGDGV